MTLIAVQKKHGEEKCYKKIFQIGIQKIQCTYQCFQPWIKKFYVLVCMTSSTRIVKYPKSQCSLSAIAHFSSLSALANFFILIYKSECCQQGNLLCTHEIKPNASSNAISCRKSSLLNSKPRYFIENYDYSLIQ